MTILELKDKASRSAFFSNLGTPADSIAVVKLSSLDPWGKESVATFEDLAVANDLEWLPSSPDQGDPFYGSELEIRLTASGIGEHARLLRKEVRALVMRSTSGKTFSLLKSGSHDFNVPARRAAVDAFARAVNEALLGIDGWWCQIVRIYADGHWPCGRKKSDGRIVVY